MGENEESDWLEGRRSAYVTLLNQCLRELGYDAPEVAQLIAEREMLIVVLRRLCKEHGDNNWTEQLNLADILDKHLGKYLG